jgi:hypothetical protein
MAAIRKVDAIWLITQLGRIYDNFQQSDIYFDGAVEDKRATDRLERLKKDLQLEKMPRFQQDLTFVFEPRCTHCALFQEYQLKNNFPF